MDQKIEEWIESLRKDKDIQIDLSNRVKEILEGADRVSVMPDVLGSIFESLDKGNPNFQNLIMYWGLENYVMRKVAAQRENIDLLYEFCVTNGHNRENWWEWGSGDRQVCYIPSENKKVLLFRNQNIEFVVVSIPERYKLNIRRVYPDLFSEENLDYGFYNLGTFPCVDDLRKALKGENGLEIALANLTSEYRRWSDSIPGVKYPSRISLKSMENDGFDSPNPAFQYGDARDKGYILSLDIMMRRCEITDYYESSYAFYDVIGAIGEMEKLKSGNQDEHAEI